MAGRPGDLFLRLVRSAEQRDRTVSPSFFAVLAFMGRLNLVRSSTGRSAGSAPFKTLATSHRRHRFLRGVRPASFQSRCVAFFTTSHGD